MLSSQNFRVAVLGAGGIAVTHAAALKSLPGIELVAVCDVAPARARAFQQRWSVPEAFEDVEVMLARVSPDAVHVLLPPAAHAKACETCLSAGSHVFVEKPFCISLQECRQVQRTAERLGRKIGVDHNLTYYPGVLDALDYIRSCRLGAIEHVTVNYIMPDPGVARGVFNHWMFASPENIMLELGPHPVSLVYRLLGKVTDCNAVASGPIVLPDQSRTYHTWQASLVCQRGTGSLVLSVGKSYSNRWVHILGEDGEIEIDFGRLTVNYCSRSPYLRSGKLRQDIGTAGSLVRQSVANFFTQSVSSIGLTAASSWQDTSIRYNIGSFYAALAAGSPIPIGAEEGTAVVEACLSIVASALDRVRLEGNAVYA